jgi:phytoene synthase
VCERITRDHYENFPVASLFVPRGRRAFLTALYAFARGADDIADEGSLSPAERLRQLDIWETLLDACIAGKADHPVFVALGDTVARTGIPRKLLADLLTAFRMDVTVSSYRTFEDLRWYCRHSANPVGRLVLTVFGQATERTMDLSDHVCTALQLTNFWQDLSVDIARGRKYLPLDDCDRFGYTDRDFETRRTGEAFGALMAFQIRRTRDLFAQGRPLLQEVGGGLRFELELTWRGGNRVLDTIEAHGYDVLFTRRTLSLADKLKVLSGAAFRSHR